MVEFSDLDEVWMVVTPHNPHKKKSTLLADHHRLEMVYRATEAYDNAMASVTTAVSDAYEGSMVWVADNVFAEDTWVGQGMNWAADAGDKLSNMYDYMIENPERAFATIGEGLEEP